MANLRENLHNMNPHEIHMHLIKHYMRSASNEKLAKIQEKYRTDYDVLRQNHRFLWEDEGSTSGVSPSLSWEERFAKKYYDKLFKEYCICDLTLYKENKVALRWRTENEVVGGKGQFTCADKKCTSKTDLRTWEVNFGYREKSGEKKNALVKIRLCDACSVKLNYRSKKREIKRCKKRRHHSKTELTTTSKITKKGGTETPTSETNAETPNQSHTSTEKDNSHYWDAGNVESGTSTVTKSRDEEMEDYLKDLLL